MQNDRPVSKIRSETLDKRRVWVVEAAIVWQVSTVLARAREATLRKHLLPFKDSPKGSAGTIDFPKLSGQVAHLARSRRFFVTDRFLSSDVLPDVRPHLRFCMFPFELTGSKCAKVAVQFPSAGTGATCRWYSFEMSAAFSNTLAWKLCARRM